MSQMPLAKCFIISEIRVGYTHNSPRLKAEFFSRAVILWYNHYNSNRNDSNQEGGSMNKVLLLSFFALLLAGAAFGQAGGIALYFNGAFTSSYYDDITPALVPVYAVHVLCPGATASQFMVQPGGGWNCTFVGEVIAVPVSIGSSLGGLSAGYGGCLASNILITTMNWFCQGTSPECAYLEVVPDIAAPTGTIEIVDCNFVKLVGIGGTAYMNPPGGGWNPCVVPTKNTNWGQVKALYR